jgi:hypothetical protein
MSNDPACVTNWMVSEEVSHSDHRVIQFSINDIKKTEAILRQNVRKVNWAAVSSDLRGAVPRDRPATWTRASLDAACESLTCALQESLDKHAPKKPPAANFNYWWNEECTEKKSLQKTVELSECRHPTSTTKLDLQTKRDEYKTAIYTAKRTSWKKFIKEVDSTPAMARVNKVMRASGAPAAELGLVKDNLGVLEKDKTETPACLARIIRFLTGHTFMNRHEVLIQRGKDDLGSNDALCRLCEEEMETPEHLLTECPVLNNDRQELFNSYQLS